jgi:hypothetical protein
LTDYTLLDFDLDSTYVSFYYRNILNWNPNCNNNFKTLWVDFPHKKQLFQNDQYSHFIIIVSSGILSIFSGLLLIFTTFITCFENTEEKRRKK